MVLPVHCCILCVWAWSHGVSHVCVCAHLCASLCRAGFPSPFLSPRLFLFVADAPRTSPASSCRSTPLLLVGNGSDALVSVVVAGLTGAAIDFVPANQTLTLTTPDGDVSRSGAIMRYLARRTAHGAAALEGSAAFEIAKV
jgi:hypothetical protein